MNPVTSMTLTRTLLPCLLALAALAGCGKEAPATPATITGDTLCALDGMLLTDFPGPKGQIQYASGETEFFCDTVELVSMILQPESRRPVRAAFTQDMAATDWDTPRDHWIDAREAYFVVGSDARGSMGPTFATFARRGDAAAFAKSRGGEVLRIADITPEMADLRGGAGMDEGM